jgi:ATP-dependent protease Clp ATPase subunit
MEGEMQKLLKLQDELDKKVIGQQDATKVVAEAIQRFIYIYLYMYMYINTFGDKE